MFHLEALPCHDPALACHTPARPFDSPRADAVTGCSAVKIVAYDYRVPPGSRVDLTQWPTRTDALCRSSAHAARRLRRQAGHLSDAQQLLYANNRHALLLVFQAMDAAGKDGAIRHVMSGVNPQGCQVFSYQHPSEAERQHDFLWRTTRDLPERGRIGIFNRSYYEEVLIVRVHREILLGEGLGDVGEAVWPQRMRSIVDLERHLHANGTRIVKFFLHLSPQEQRRRFIERIDDPHKCWKFSAADLHERGFWPQYMRAYEACLGATSTEDSPWYVVPADDKDNSRLIVSHIVRETFASLGMAYPVPDAARRRELQVFRTALAG